MRPIKPLKVSTSLAPAPRGAYSQGIAVGDFVFTAGLGPVDPVTRETIGAGIGDQTRQTLQNLAVILEAAGASLHDVVKVTAHLSNIDDDWEAFDVAYREFFTEPLPVRTTAGSSLGGILVEIDVVAVRGTRQNSADQESHDAAQ